MYYEYIETTFRRDPNTYHIYLEYLGFSPNFSQDYFRPHTPHTLELEIPRENIIIVDSIQNLKNIVSTTKKNLCIDLEYSKEDIVSIMQIADQNTVYIIDYLKLVRNPEFFPTFQSIFKNNTFIAFGMDVSDFKMLNDDFRNFFKNNPSRLIDLKNLYQEKYDNEKCPSLSNLCMLLLGKPLCKYYQCSNWDKRPLLEGQLHYAALDSHVLYKLYLHFENFDTPKDYLKKQNLALVQRKEDRKLFDKLEHFADAQILFLENEKHVIESLSGDLKDKTLDVILK
jgi:ribonuclease D